MKFHEKWSTLIIEEKNSIFKSFIFNEVSKNLKYFIYHINIEERNIDWGSGGI